MAKRRSLPGRRKESDANTLCVSPAKAPRWRCSTCARSRRRPWPQEIRAGGGKAIALVADVTSQEQMDGAAQQTLSQLGGIDVLINNAATYYDYNMRDQSIEYGPQSDGSQCLQYPDRLARGISAA